MNGVSQAESSRISDIGGSAQTLSIAEADIIFYGNDALAGAKEFASLDVGQGFSTMTPGLGQAVTVLVRRGIWALYEQENYRGEMTLVSPSDTDIVYGSLQVGIHNLKTAVCSYKRVR
jgi:Beta/Gamma crystallin